MFERTHQGPRPLNVWPLTLGTMAFWACLLWTLL